uniref:DNA-directed RNA polymerase subunit n=1 Tax=Lactuca sativa TaxID=4236 RepID=A0A9R1UXX6_LACSA|nr:hypothetical protein LSAT_V11C700345660 [Lactuca sativa]
MELCPTCGMLLKYELPNLHLPTRFFYTTCPYVSQIEQKVKIKRRQRLVKKEIDPIIIHDDMKNAPKTHQDCGHNKAAYIQFQTRSADEPMTINFTCEKYGKCWRED